MGDVLFHKALRDLRFHTLGWGAGIGALVLFMVLLYPTVAELYAGVEIPEAFRAFLGDAVDLTTFEGFLSAEFASYGAVFLAIFAIIAGSGALASEESDGTMDLLLSQPVTRTRVVLTKALALALAMAGIVLIIVGFFWLGTLFIDAGFSPSRAMLAFALLWPFEMAVAYLSMLLPLVVAGRRTAGALIGAVLGASYILASISNVVDSLATFRPLFISEYYRGDEALTGEVAWGYVVGSAGIGLAALALTVFLFQRRDIAAQAGLRVRLPWKRGVVRAE